MSRFRTLIKEEVEYYFGPKKTKYVLIYSNWKGPSGDDKFIEEINVGDDLEKAKEKCKNLSIELNKLVDIYDYESNTHVARYIKGIETDQYNQPINEE